MENNIAKHTFHSRGETVTRMEFDRAFAPELAATLSALDSQLSGGSEKFIGLSSESGSITTLGSLMVALDREMRRTAAQTQIFGEISIGRTVMEKNELAYEVRGAEVWAPLGVKIDPVERSRRSKEGIAPSPLSEAGLSLASAEGGSGHFIFDVVGSLQSILTTTPATALVNVVTLMGGFTQLAVYSRHKLLSKGQFQAGMKDSKGDASRFLNVPKEAWDIRSGARLTAPDGSIAVGKSITQTITHTSADGSQVQSTIQIFG